LQALKSLLNALVFATICVAVSCHHQLSGAESDALADLLATVLSVHQLADAEDENILVLDRWQTKARRDDLKAILAALVEQVSHVRLGRQ
jgi:hypothetical protein